MNREFENIVITLLIFITISIIGLTLHIVTKNETQAVKTRTEIAELKTYIMTLEGVRTDREIRLVGLLTDFVNGQSKFVERIEKSEREHFNLGELSGEIYTQKPYTIIEDTFKVAVFGDTSFVLINSNDAKCYQHLLDNQREMKKQSTLSKPE